MATVGATSKTKETLQARVIHADGSVTEYGHVVGGGIIGKLQRARNSLRGVVKGMKNNGSR